MNTVGTLRRSDLISPGAIPMLKGMDEAIIADFLMHFTFQIKAESPRPPEEAA